MKLKQQHNSGRINKTIHFNQINLYWYRWYAIANNLDNPKPNEVSLILVGNVILIVFTYKNGMEPSKEQHRSFHTDILQLKPRA